VLGTGPLWVLILALAVRRLPDGLALLAAVAVALFARDPARAQRAITVLRELRRRDRRRLGRRSPP
jgi:hypothetical protein